MYLHQFLFGPIEIVKPHYAVFESTNGGQMRPKTNDFIMDYIIKLYEPQDSIFGDVLERLENQNRLGINIGVVEAQLLKVLIRLHQPKKIVECGTLFGYSTLQMASALPLDAHIFTIERDLASAEQAKKTFSESRLQNQITLLIGEVDHHLNSLADQAPFDMIFIDHNKAGYLSALKWSEKNLKQGGLIVADNSLLWGEVALEKNDRASASQLNAMREFNRELSVRDKYTSVLLPTSEGLSIAVKEFS